jgi:hypothetical protein
MLYKENYSSIVDVSCFVRKHRSSRRHAFEAKVNRAVGKTENFLLRKIISQNILLHNNHKFMLNCYCQLSSSSSAIFRQYGVSQSECKIDRPRPGLSRLAPCPHTKALGTRLLGVLI